MNAIAHRDYTSNGSIQIMIFSDRVEIWNPGHLPPNLTIDDLFSEHSSIPTNPLIAESLFLAQYIEKVGSGTVDIIRICQEVGLPLPKFQIQGGNFVFTVYRASVEVPVEVPVEVSVEVSVKLTPTEERIISFLKSGEYQTKEILNYLGYEKKTGNYRKAIGKLLELKIIEMTKPDIPNTKNQEYRLVKND